MVRTNMTREQFTACIERENKARRELLAIYKKVFLPILTKFNGKVYNKRFRTAIQEQLDALDPDKYTRIREEYNSGNKQLTLVISKQTEKFNYYAKKQLYIQLVLDASGRISEADTLAEKTGQNWLKNFMEETDRRTDAGDKWDEYMAVCDQLKAACESYNHLPYYFKDIVQAHQFHVY